MENACVPQMRKVRSPPLNFSTLHQYLPPCCSQFTYILISNLGARLPTGLDHLPYANAEGEGLGILYHMVSKL